MSWIYWLAFLVAYVFLLGLDTILGPAFDKCRLELDLAPKIFIDHRQKVQLKINTPFKGRLLVRLHLDCPKPLETEDFPTSLLFGPQDNQSNFILFCHRRGQFFIEGIWLLARGPLGLMARQHHFELRQQVEVVPNLQRVGNQALQLHPTQSPFAGNRIERFMGDGSEFEQMREYVPGFDIRTIDWKASARHAKLLCRQLRAERNRQLMVVIDSGRLMAEPLDKVPRLDHAIHAGLVLSYISLSLGDRVGLASFDQRLNHFIDPVSGLVSFSALTNLSSQIHYSQEETNYTLGLMELSQQLTRRALLIVITDFVDTITAQLMVDNLGHMAGRHKVLFVSLKDPLLRNLADRQPETLNDLHLATVAHKLAMERGEVIQKLRMQGIHCIDTHPDQMSPQLVDRYLKLKRREAF
jgi:uncharacterized protein (DUF58 family)